MQLLPIITELLKRIQPVIAAVTQWIGKNPELTKTIVLATAAIAGILVVVPALAAAIAFVLSPIGLITIAIAGVVAIGVVLIRHWDYVKRYAPQVFGAVMNVIGAFQVDVVRSFWKIATSADDIFAAIGLAIQGKFSEAKEVLKTALVPDLKYTKQEYAKLAGIVEPIGEDIKATFKGVTDDIKNSLGSTIPVIKNTGGALSEAGKKGAAAMDSFKEKAKDVQTSLGELITDYTKKSKDQLDSYNDKVAAINKDIARTKADYERDSAEAQMGYQDEVVKSYIEHQKTIAGLNKDIATAQKEIDKGGSSEEDRDKLAALRASLTKENELLKQYSKEFANISDLAAKELARTDLDNIKEKYLSEKMEKDRQHTEKMLDLQLKLDEELKAYTKQKNDLVLDMEDKFKQLNVKLQEGWDKMIEETKGKVANMKALESSVLAIKASIEAARASVNAAASNASTKIPHLASGGIVTSPTLALIGEAGPEAVVPLNGKSGGIGGGTTVNISVGNFWGGDPERAAREMGDLIIKRLQLNARVA